MVEVKSSSLVSRGGCIKICAMLDEIRAKCDEIYAPPSSNQCNTRCTGYWMAGIDNAMYIEMLCI